jgi:hypothetical protein
MPKYIDAGPISSALDGAKQPDLGRDLGSQFPKRRGWVVAVKSSMAAVAAARRWLARSCPCCSPDAVAIGG